MRLCALSCVQDNIKCGLKVPKLRVMLQQSQAQDEKPLDDMLVKQLSPHKLTVKSLC